MRHGGPIAVALPLVMACGSFGSATNDAPADAGSSADAGGGGPFHCPSPKPKNTDCWDFEATTPLASETQSGTVVRVTGDASKGAWMKATTEPAPTATAWARLVEVVGALTPLFEIDAVMSIADGNPASLVEVHLRRDGMNRHELVLLVDEGAALSLEQASYVNGAIVQTTYAKKPLGVVSLDTWFHLHMRVEIMGGSQPSATVGIEIDDTPRLVGDVSTIDPSVGPTAVDTLFGLTYVPQPTRSALALFDDVQMTWKLP